MFLAYPVISICYLYPNQINRIVLWYIYPKILLEIRLWSVVDSEKPY